MKLQNKSFHKSWISSVQNREKNTTKTLSIKKYILKIIFLSLIILTLIIVLRWWQNVPNNEILDIDKEQNLNQADALIKPIILFKNKNKSIVTVKASKPEVISWAFSELVNKKININEKLTTNLLFIF